MAKGGGHHGGAWKVAYADFVTAMMALFMVLWLSSQDQKIKEAIARSFTNPFNNPNPPMGGPVVGKPSVPAPSGEASASGQSPFSSAVELAMLRQLNQDLLKALNKPDEDEENIKLELTPEGLRITVFDRNKKPVFEPDSDQFSEYGSWAFSTVAWQVARYPNFRVELEGHTEKGHIARRANYTSWELTTDRANAARRKLIDHGVKTNQIRKVAGFADTLPLAAFPPDHEGQRRVSVMLKVGPVGN